MIRFDRITQVLLASILLVLGILVLRGPGSAGSIATPEAQAAPNTRTIINKLGEIPVTNFRDIVLLGDQKTFIIRTDLGVAIYQVQEVRN